jgi:hypothetical protein
LKTLSLSNGWPEVSEVIRRSVLLIALVIAALALDLLALGAAIVWVWITS